MALPQLIKELDLFVPIQGPRKDDLRRLRSGLKHYGADDDLGYRFPALELPLYLEDRIHGNNFINHILDGLKAVHNMWYSASYTRGGCFDSLQLKTPMVFLIISLLKNYASMGKS